ncbi:GNAT family N-acetyltransferase [Amphibacillus sediminis]|uniref:GNAT family N-acetyltransferase n=1 Tax=Amphibacillus sediminis TaxID=360185 RepID=UPI001FDF461E|nr:GNAT family N-acetyltransferase [Amphibacillus sediminis]
MSSRLLGYNSETHDHDYIRRIIAEFYNYERVLQEVTKTNWEWGGYFVALDNNQVVGAGGGGMIAKQTGEIFVLYVDPARRNQGIGTLLIRAITDQQKTNGATTQWVSVQKDNQKGIPFYEAKGFVFSHLQSGYGNNVNESYQTARYYRKL